MKTHYHLILGVGDGALPRGMHRLNLAYALHHNRRYGLRGRVQFARYGARRLHDEAELVHAFSYVANNPVRAELCRSPADWPWSSYAGTVGAAGLASFVESRELRHVFAGCGIDPRAALRTFVEAA